MIDFMSPQFAIFLVAAIVLAFSPGPGMTYVIARTASGGKKIGLASSFGTGAGGLLHVAAAALGLSALITKSAFVFTALKYIGACYLLYLGLKIILSRSALEIPQNLSPINIKTTFWQGFTVEVFNIKTALFFLAFIPQFINPLEPIASQFILYGTICVLLNTIADLIAVYGVDYLITKLKSTKLINVISGSTLIGLGFMVATSDARR